MGYAHLNVEVTGIAPLLMHNTQLANPMNPFTRKIKEITSKGKKKTDTDLEELMRLEFLGGLYVNEKGRPCVPGIIVEGTIRDGAKKSRSGKDSQCGIISDGDWELIYDGPKDQDELWNDDRFRDFRPVVVGKARVMRMRPKFWPWSLKFTVSYLEEIVSANAVCKWITDAGQYTGMMDFRPRFGRFEVKKIS